MVTQGTNKYIKQCWQCDNDIQRTEIRKVDRGLHYHLTCPKKTKPVDDILNEFLEWH